MINNDDDTFEQLNYNSNFHILAERRKREKRYIAVGFFAILVLSILIYLNF